MKSKTKYILAGYIFCSVLNSLSQDYLGKEKYIELVNNNWKDANVSVPIALVLLLFPISQFLRKDKAETANNED